MKKSQYILPYPYQLTWTILILKLIFKDEISEKKQKTDVSKSTVVNKTTKKDEGE